MRSLALFALAAALTPGIALAQATPTSPTPVPVVSTDAQPFHFEVTGFYHTLDHDYGTWRGVDTRLMYVSPQASPFVFASTQTRRDGTQQNFGAGSYVTFAPWLSAILGVSAAPKADVELYPKIRGDATLMATVPGAPGLLATAGYTEIRYRPEGSGTHIVSVGPVLYAGRGIYQAAVRFNTDRAGGAHSQSYTFAGQWGAQKLYWIGLGLGGGNEAYQVLSATPFDAHFRSRSANAFLQKWVTKSQGVTVRYDFERKLQTYTRNGVSLGYFVDF